MEEDILMKKFSNKIRFFQLENFGVISQKDLDTDEEKYKEIIKFKTQRITSRFYKN